MGLCGWSLGFMENGDPYNESVEGIHVDKEKKSLF